MHDATPINPATACGPRVAAARRPVFGALVAPFAAGPVRADVAAAMLDELVAAVQARDAETVRSLHSAVYDDAGRHTADGVLLAAATLERHSQLTAPGPGQLPDVADALEAVAGAVLRTVADWKQAHPRGAEDGGDTDGLGSTIFAAVAAEVLDLVAAARDLARTHQALDRFLEQHADRRDRCAAELLAALQHAGAGLPAGTGHPLPATGRGQ
ncbi:hypothetical protein [Streptacidiphilus sp. EB103A]|uniref:hypothetical protein n=1 Tax=Streptacidiphilus sp. EB103A TaxID=3156275 RepID=UPI003514546D